MRRCFNLGSEPLFSTFRVVQFVDLLQAGAAMLQGLAAQRQPGAGPALRIERDPHTGQASLRVP
jgi:hypothetical protein